VWPDFFSVFRQFSPSLLFCVLVLRWPAGRAHPSSLPAAGFGPALVRTQIFFFFFFLVFPQTHFVGIM